MKTILIWFMLLILVGCRPPEQQISSIEVGETPSKTSPEPLSQTVRIKPSPSRTPIPKVSPERDTGAQKIVPRETPRQTAEDVLDQMKSVNLSFSYVDTLNIDQIGRAELILTPEEIEQTIQHEINQTPLYANIVTSKVVIADLISVDNTLDIFVVGSKRQALSFKESTYWHWNISPKVEGQHRMILSVTAVVVIDGIKAERNIKTFSKILTVDITDGQIAKRFFKEHWQWIFAAFIFPLLGLIKKLITS